MRPINEIIVHCAATKNEWMEGRKTSEKVAEIRKWHKNQGWNDIGYHFLIDRDGTVAKGRDVSLVGAHVSGHNTGTIGVCLIGGYYSKETDPFLKNYTPAQEKALKEILENLKKEYPAITKITGHNQYAAKACPGFNVPSWLKEGSVKVVKDTPTVTKETPNVAPKTPKVYNILDVLVNLARNIFKPL